MITYCIFFLLNTVLFPIPRLLHRHITWRPDSPNLTELPSREGSCSNLGLETGYPDRECFRFSWVPPDKRRNNTSVKPRPLPSPLTVYLYTLYRVVQKSLYTRGILSNIDCQATFACICAVAADSVVKWTRVYSYNFPRLDSQQYMRGRNLASDGGAK